MKTCNRVLPMKEQAGKNLGLAPLSEIGEGVRFPAPAEWTREWL